MQFLTESRSAAATSNTYKTGLGIGKLGPCSILNTSGTIKGSSWKAGGTYRELDL
jgi:hypothetical protein